MDQQSRKLLGRKGVGFDLHVKRDAFDGSFISGLGPLLSQSTFSRLDVGCVGLGLVPVA